MKIITAEERMAERRGVKALILGPPGVGKTSLLRTLDPETTLFLDFEAGDLAVQDVAVDQVRPTTWTECRDLACFLAGPNVNGKPDEVYGQDHYDAIAEQYSGLDLDKYETLFIDSITVAGRMCFAWSEQQPEAMNAKGTKDTRGVYGLHGREMVRWITRLQHARTKHVIFVCLLESHEDDFKRVSWVPQIEGSKTGREMPGIVDEVITMQVIRPEEGAPYRAFVTCPENEWEYPAKDRSGRLEPLEQPDLGVLIHKITGDARGPSARSAPRASSTPSTSTEKEAA